MKFWSKKCLVYGHACSSCGKNNHFKHVVVNCLSAHQHCAYQWAKISQNDHIRAWPSPIKVLCACLPIKTRQLHTWHACCGKNMNTQRLTSKEHNAGAVVNSLCTVSCETSLIKVVIFLTTTSTATYLYQNELQTTSFYQPDHELISGLTLPSTKVKPRLLHGWCRVSKLSHWHKCHLIPWIQPRHSFQWCWRCTYATNNK